jgi:DNA-binding winged helix-turn-helix (wHTH) protein/tetratricopeptide (TPR) repeat protein
LETQATELFRFEDFELDLRAQELRKHGHRIPLQPQPFRVLTLLLERSGELVTHQELHRQIWSKDMFVDFDRGLTRCINKLREVLGDSAESPRFIETRNRLGYRFIATLKPEASTERTRVASHEPGQAPALPQRVPAPKMAGVSIAFAAAALLLVVAVGWVAWRTQRAPSPVVRNSGWVLVTAFENHTGNPLLDGTLEYAMERELSNSQFVKVVSRERVQDALRLMRKPLDATIDAAIAREVCLRDGEIGTLLTGRVEKVGTTYVLSVQIVDPRGVAVASFTEEDAAETQLAAAIRRLSNRVRERLGEEPALVGMSNANLEKVTTPSLRALQLYTQADRVVASGPEGDRIAARFLEEALQIDPDFASAHVLLGHAYANLKDNGKAKPHFQRAFDLADSTPPKERFFILGSYYARALHDDESAAANYEILVRLYPDSRFGVGNLIATYARLGRGWEATEVSVRRAESRPNQPNWNHDAAYRLALRDDWKRGEPFYERASALLSSSPDSANPWTVQHLRLVPACALWAQGNLALARAALIQVERSGNYESALAPDEVPDLVPRFYATLGELREAEKRYAALPDRDKGEANEGAAILAYSRGDLAATRTILKRLRDDELARSASPEFLAIIMIHVGLTRRAYDVRAHAVKPGSFATYAFDAIAALDGELALTSGQSAGVVQLEHFLPAREPLPAIYFLVAEDLAQTYRRQKKLADAQRVLEKAAATIASPIDWSAGFRMRVQFRLAEVYREVGRVQDAEKIEADLRRRLIFADPDHPIRLALNQRRPPLQPSKR